MLLTEDAFEDTMMSRAANRETGATGNRCFRWVQVKGRYLFHIDIRMAEDPTYPRGHFLTTHIDNLLRMLGGYTTQEFEVRVTLQTPFSASGFYDFSEILEITKGYDKTRNEIFGYRCKNGQTYFMPVNAQYELDNAVTVWP